MHRSSGLSSVAAFRSSMMSCTRASDARASRQFHRGDANMFQRSERYMPRPVEFLELLERDGWRIKVYSIVYGDAPLNRAPYAEAVTLALRDLPKPAVTTTRP